MKLTALMNVNRQHQIQTVCVSCIYFRCSFICVFRCKQSIRSISHTPYGQITIPNIGQLCASGLHNCITVCFFFLFCIQFNQHCIYTHVPKSRHTDTLARSLSLYPSQLYLFFFYFFFYN